MYWQIQNKLNGEGEIKITGEITKYDFLKDEYTSSNSFENELKRLENCKKIILRINSPGGDPLEANRIYNLIKNTKVKVITRVEGVAASAATIIAAAGDEIEMYNNSLFMIHNPYFMYCSGDAKGLASKIDFLNKVKETVISSYKAKTGKSEEELSKLMDDETWFTAKEAKEHNFIDKIIDEDTSNVANLSDLSGLRNHFSKIPLEVQTRLQNELNNQSQLTSNNNQNIKESTMTIKELKSEYPHLVDAIKNELKEEIQNNLSLDKEELKNEAIAAERERIAALNNLANIPGTKEIIKNAIESGQSVAEATMEIATSDDIKNMALANAELDDIKNSEANNIPAEPASEGDKPEFNFENLANIYNNL